MSTLRHQIRHAGAIIGCVALLSIGAGLTASTAGAASSGVQSDCPSTTANAKYVRYLYVMALGRCPDAGGLAFWTAKLDNGASRRSVADAFVWSNEVLGGSVFRFYGDVLHRAPTGPEIGAGMATMNRDIEDLKTVLLAGNEYYNTFGGNATNWLKSLYPAILEGRSADAGGLAFFGAMLGSNPSLTTRTKVVNALVHSTEEHRFWVVCSYGPALLRDGSPSEIAWWVNWLNGPGNGNTQAMWAIFLSSNEGFAKAQYQPNLPIS